jgi:hypothetical protein
VTLPRWGWGSGLKGRDEVIRTSGVSGHAVEAATRL